MRLKRFIIFTGSSYYPLKGWNDFYQKSFDSLEQAQSYIKKINIVEKDGFGIKNYSFDWVQVVDIFQGEIVFHIDTD